MVPCMFSDRLTANFEDTCCDGVATNWAEGANRTYAKKADGENTKGSKVSSHKGVADSSKFQF